METKYFTLAQAEAICRRYQHLVNKPLNADKGWLIDCIAVAPADNLNQWLFAHSYMDLGDPVAARLFYKHNTYDVIAISVYDRKNELLAFKDIRGVLESKGEQFEIPRFTGNDRIDGAARVISIEKLADR